MINHESFSITLVFGIMHTSKPAYARRISQTEVIRERRNEYIKQTNLTIYCATWNVASCNPPEDLKEWLFTSDEAPDFYVISLQEICTEAEQLLNLPHKIQKKWTEIICHSLNCNGDYYEIETVRMSGIMMIVIAKEQHLMNIRKRAKGVLSRGVLKILENKGAVGISFYLYENLICFINSHLAAHQNEVNRRNEDFNDIEKHLQFGSESLDKTRNVCDHDVIFWMGDLNYRINNLIVHSKTVQYTEVMGYDQLYVARAENKIFQGYSEGLINFPPTYKYDIGTDNNSLMRTPAWCDRVLFKGNGCKTKQYMSVMTMRQSDHKPVYGIYTLLTAVKDLNKLQQIVEEVLQIDNYEIDLKPEVSISKKSIDFRILKINDYKRRSLTITNTSLVPILIKLTTSLSFIEISCVEAALLPEQEINIKVDLQVTQKVGVDLLKSQSKNSQLLGNLVVNIQDGDLREVPLFAEFKPSCFGLDFETMMKLKGPINEYLWENLGESNGAPNVPIPREIVVLIDFLIRKGTRCEDLFVRKTGGKDFDGLNKIRDALDSWSSFDDADPYEVAEALLRILELAPQSLISMTQYEVKCCKEDFDLSVRVLRSRVQLLHWRIFLYICLFLRELPRNINKTLDSIFANVLFRTKDNTADDREYRRQLVDLFLKSSNQKFELIAGEEF